MTKLAIIHTTPVTVSPLKELAAEIIPDAEIVNFVDDSILPQLAETNGDLSKVAYRVVQYAQFAQDVGADAVLEACSSVGEAVQAAQREVSIPVVRIDEAMAEMAVERGRRIAVAATLATTLNPTMQLLRTKAADAGKDVELRPVLVSEAYQRLIAGDKEGHDQLLQQRLAEAAETVDVVVLAQASMARAIADLPAVDQKRFLTSPRLGMERVRRVLAERGN